MNGCRNISTTYNTHSWMQLPFTWYTCIRSADCQNSQTVSNESFEMHWLNFKLCTRLLGVLSSFHVSNVRFVLYSLFTIHTTATDDISMNDKWRYCSRYCCVNTEYIMNIRSIERQTLVKCLSGSFLILFSISFLILGVYKAFISISLSFLYALEPQSIWKWYIIRSTFIKIRFQTNN